MGTRGRLVVFLASVATIACSRSSSAQPPWTQVLATSCVPGSAFDKCMAALDQAGVKPQHSPFNATAPDRHFWIKLAAPFEMVTVAAKDLKGGFRITKVDFTIDLPPGAQRKEVLGWIKTNFKTLVAVDPVDGCGGPWGGPGFGASKDANPEVQFSVSESPAPNVQRGGKGKKLDDWVVKTKSDATNLCFLLPETDAGWPDKPGVPTALKDFVESSPLKDKIVPKP